MKVEILEEPRLVAKVGARTVSGLFLSETWMGLHMYRTDKGDTIILDSENENKFVKGSHDIVSLLNLHDIEPGFIPVPASTIKWGDKVIDVPAFHIEQYLATLGPKGQAICTTTGKPETNISQHDAAQACINAERLLLRGSQALAISRNIASVAKNWTGGEVGKGELIQGLHKGNISGPVSNDCESPNPAERRWLELTNGYRIYDWSGHLWEHMFDDIHGDENGVVKGSIPADSPYLTSAPYPSMEKGMGYIYKGPLSWSGRALVRGGCWDSGGHAGAFRLDYCYPEYRDVQIGFRSTKTHPGL